MYDCEAQLPKLDSESKRHMRFELYVLWRVIKIE